MAYEAITYEVDDRVAIITFNRPKRMNAMSLQLCKEVKQAVEEADSDPDIRVVIVTGAGGKAFSAGYDLNDPDDPVSQAAEGEEQPGINFWRDRLNHDLEYTYSVWNCSKPVICMINGYCLAGGLEFAQMCDIRYCSDDSKFGVVETRFSNGVATLAMPWIIGSMCRELIYTGDTIDAEEALRIGLVNKVFPKADLERETMMVAKRMSQVAMACLQWNKRAINNTHDSMGFRAAMQYGVEACSIMDATETPEFKAFDAIKQKDGLTAAIRWRHEQFEPYD
jgi:enoyl-CoA hydratase/carnithine racemase